jgi:hypothetical protein
MQHVSKTVSRSFFIEGLRTRWYKDNEKNKKTAVSFQKAAAF